MTRLAPVLTLTDVSLRFGDTDVLRDISWSVSAGEHWVVLGPNGCGKTSLLRIASLQLHPSRGEVTVLGERLGHTDVRLLRPRLGFTSAAVAASLRSGLVVEDVVMTARFGALEPWWHTYDDGDHLAAAGALYRVGCAHLATRTFGSLSSGERQRVLLARALRNDPEILFLDEPAAGLDFGGREDVVASLADLAREPSGPPTVLVTHHLEEIPPGTTHAMVLARGAIAAVGALEDVITEEALSAAFDRSVRITRHGHRWAAHAP